MFSLIDFRHVQWNKNHFAMRTIYCLKNAYAQDFVLSAVMGRCPCVGWPPVGQIYALKGRHIVPLVYRMTVVVWGLYWFSSRNFVMDFLGSIYPVQRLTNGPFFPIFNCRGIFLSRLERTEPDLTTL